MTQLPPDEQQWQEFLRKHCSPPPAAAGDLEEQLMNAIEQTSQPTVNWQWALPSALAASLLMAWSGYRILIPLPKASNASLEAFLENNWNEVVLAPETSPSNTQTEWILEASAAK